MWAFAFQALACKGCLIVHQAFQEHVAFLHFSHESEAEGFRGSINVFIPKAGFCKAPSPSRTLCSLLGGTCASAHTPKNRSVGWDAGRHTLEDGYALKKLDSFMHNVCRVGNAPSQACGTPHWHHWQRALHPLVCRGLSSQQGSVWSNMQYFGLLITGDFSRSVWKVYGWCASLYIVNPPSAAFGRQYHGSTTPYNLTLRSVLPIINR